MSGPRPFDLIVFDFDGVVADSELAANLALAEAVTALGRPTTLEHSVGRYMGRRWADCLPLVAEDLGFPPPEGFRAACEADLGRRLAAELKPVRGVAAFIDRFADIPRCLASSSSHAWLAEGLARMGLADRFGSHVFSASEVERGKPAPDLFLHAARRMGADPARALVIEDSVAGVTAGIAAGMTTAGLCAGSHAGAPHADRLRDAGARFVADSYEALASWIEDGPSASAGAA